jgi:amidohydrolase
MPSTTIENAKLIQDELVQMRRHLHKHPELNFVEYETSKFATEKLQALGFAVSSKGGKTGLVADIGQGKTTIAIRCDMDALPIGELNRSVFTSKNEGVMHACGHDAHLACTLGAAQLLSKMDLPGRLRIIVQPGDDANGKPGAATMIDAGALEGVSAVLSLHVDATVPTNKVGIVASTLMPSVQHFVIDIKDSDADEFADTSLATANIVRALYDLKVGVGGSEEIGITVNSVHCENAPSHSGGRHSMIDGVLKTFKSDTKERLKEEIEKIAKTTRSQAVVEFQEGSAESVDNSLVTKIMHDAAVDLLGGKNVLSIKRKSWNYQFSLLTEHVPGSMIYLGAEIASSRRSHQSPTFDIDENCLYVGAAVLAETAFRLMDGF